MNLKRINYNSKKKRKKENNSTIFSLEVMLMFFCPLAIDVD